MFAPSKKAGHMGATDQPCETDQQVLANGVPSTHGTLRTSTKPDPGKFYDLEANEKSMQAAKSNVRLLYEIKTPMAAHNVSYVKPGVPVLHVSPQ